MASPFVRSVIAVSTASLLIVASVVLLSNSGGSSTSSEIAPTEELEGRDLLLAFTRLTRMDEAEEERRVVARKRTARVIVRRLCCCGIRSAGRVTAPSDVAFAGRSRQSHLVG